MSFNAEVRLKQLENLEQYISSSRDKVQSIFDCLKWNSTEVLKETSLIKCSIDPSHRVPMKNSEEHIKKCSLRKDGYNLNEEFLSEAVHDANSSIIIDDYKKVEILSAAHNSIPNFKTAWNGQDPDPKTANRLMCTFSPDERAMIYSYAAKNTVGPPVLPDFNTLEPPKSSNKPLSYDELRMRERDARRRRIKYKSVHTNRKNHVEVIREVINGQMELYTEWLVDNGLVQPKEEPDIPEQDIKTETQEIEEQQKSRQSSIVDDSDHYTSVSRNSTRSDSSKSTTRNHKMDNYEHNHIERSSNHHYKRSYNSDHNRSYDYHSHRHKRQRSRDRYEYKKHRRSYSKEDHHHRKYQRGYDER